MCLRKNHPAHRGWWWKDNGDQVPQEMNLMGENRALAQRNGSNDSRTLKVLAIVPCPVCFGLQNLTLDFFGNLPTWVQSHFLNTRWSDGEFARRLDALGIA